MDKVRCSADTCYECMLLQSAKRGTRLESCGLWPSVSEEPGVGVGLRASTYYGKHAVVTHRVLGLSRMSAVPFCCKRTSPYCPMR